MLRDYPNLAVVGESEALNQIIRLRKDDVAEISSIENSKMTGRFLTGVRAVPSSATDVAATDRIGDFVNNASYAFILLDISGTPKWHRQALSVGW